MKRAWVVLIAYTLVTGVSQLLWLNFAPILSMVQSRYGVSELLASTLILVFPLLYVLLSLPAGRMIDRRGYKFTVSLGAALQAVAACVRIDDRSFTTLLVGQLGIAVAQPFVLNGVSKLVADWFADGESALATGVATIGMFLGMATAMAATPVMVEARGLRTTMVVFAAVALGAALLFVFGAKERNAARSDSSNVSLRSLLERDLILLFLISFMGIGFFNGLTTWLEQILAPNGINAISSGIVGGVLIASGIVGAGVIPLLSDRARKRKPFLVACATMALLVVYPLCSLTSFRLVLVFGALLGFSFLPAYAILLEMCTELAGAERAGVATGILMLMGNAGAVVVIVAMPIVKGDAPTYVADVLLMLALLAASIVLALFVKETFRHKAVAASKDQAA